MQDESPIDPYLAQILEGYTDTEIAELITYLKEWEAGTYRISNRATRPIWH